MIPFYLMDSNGPFRVDYLVIAGGGGGGNDSYGGGGAGGYITSVTGESSGGPSPAVERLNLFGGTPLTITVGAGGALGTNGADSVFGSIVASGGGFGGSGSNGNSGGSGGGAAPEFDFGSGTTGQGTNGGDDGGAGANFPVTFRAGGGGGAGAGGTILDAGGGLASSITGTSITRAGGGGGSAGSQWGTGGNGGAGGGGRGAYYNSYGATAGQVNTGSGGGGGYFNPSIGANFLSQSGGSGIVVLRYPSSARVINKIGPGLTYTFSDDGIWKRYIFTAGSDTITF